jgi:hypothetical protein
MTRAYYVNGIALVNAGGERCEACEQRPAVGPSISGHLVCARCAGLASTLADELAAEIAMSKARTAAKHAEDLAKCRRLIATPEGLEGDKERRARGTAQKGRRKLNLGVPCPHSGDRSAYDRAWYKANRDQKLSAVIAAQQKKKAMQRGG